MEKNGAFRKKVGAFRADRTEKNDAFRAAVLKGGTYTRTAFICEYPLNSTELHSRFNL